MDKEADTGAAGYGGRGGAYIPVSCRARERKKKRKEWEEGDGGVREVIERKGWTSRWRDVKLRREK